MADLIYRQFALVRTVIYLAALVLAAALPAASRAEVNPAYTVEGVEVDVTAENAVKAREKALDEAQVKAYQMLAERFLSAEQMAGFKAPDPITISSLVQDFEVTKEQLSTRRYKGTYTFRFRPTAMRSQLAAQGTSYSDIPKKPVLVLPLFEQGGRTMLWSESNPWMAAWRTAPSGSVMAPTIVPLGDVQDVAGLGENDGLNYDPMALQQLAARYSADDVAIVLASTEPTQTEEGRLSVNIYTNGFEGPKFVQKLAVDQLPGENADALFARAAQKVRDVLRTEWKANAAYAQAPAGQTAAAVTTTEVTTINRGPYGQAPVAAPSATSPYGRGPAGNPIPYTRQALGPSTIYKTHARFASVQEWVRMKNTLDRIYGMQAVMIKALKPREALLDIRFAGDVQALSLALQNAGITMRAGAPGQPIQIDMGQARQQIYR